MKFACFLLTACISFATAQAQSYSFEVITGNYTNLTGSTSLNNGITWDDPQFIIPLGFDFLLFGDSIDQIIIKDYGLGGFLSPDTSNTGIIPLLIPYGCDIIDRGSDTINSEGEPSSLSPISYFIEGSSGNRIFKLEWQNAGFYADMEDDNIASDYINFQLWFYESSNVIEIHFGPNSVLQPGISYEGNPGTFICLFPDFDLDNDLLVTPGYVLEGNPSAPIMKQMSLVDSLTYLNGTIPNGTIYRFSPLISQVYLPKLVNTEVDIYPNPNNGSFSLSFPESSSRTTICIYDSYGILIKEMVLPEAKSIVNMEIPVRKKGIYFLTVANTIYTKTSKFVVQ